jgi:beta-barrel assembly-enhancing protease
MAMTPPADRTRSWVPRRALLRGFGATLLSGLAAGCATNPVTGKSELMLMSEEEELNLGKEAFSELAWQQGGPLKIDPATQAYLDGIVRKLHQVSHRSNLPVDFTLESASEPNAWAIPGHTAMNRGLLQYLENEAQFAFVMGHEMGHVAARHTAARQSRATLGNAGLGVLGAAADVAGLGAVGGLAVGAAGAGTQLLLLSYDRGQELQADQLGVLYMARAGYDPNEAVRAHETLNRAIDAYMANLGQKRGDPSAMSQILSTHPRHEERVSEIQAYIKALPASEVRIEGDGRFAERWLRQTEPVRRLGPAYARYDRSLQAFSRAAQAAKQNQDSVVRQRIGESQREIDAAIQLADQAQFATLQGYLLAVLGRKGDARSAFNRAVSLYPGYQPAIKALARIGG